MALDFAVYEPELKISYDDVAAGYLKQNYPEWYALTQVGARDGNNIPKYEDGYTHRRFSFQTTMLNSVRAHNNTDPNTLETCEKAIGFCASDIFYKKLWGATRFKHEAFKEGVPPGAMLNTVEMNMRALAVDFGFDCDRVWQSGTGNAVLFNLADAGTGPDADGNWEFLIEDYGGIAGQELGYLVTALNLIDCDVQASSAIGVAAVQPTARRILLVNDTPGAESITVNGDLGDTAGGFPAAAGWPVFKSRVQDGGIQGAEDHIFGKPVLVDDGTRLNPIQNVDVLDPEHPDSDCFAPQFIARVMDGGGGSLTEPMLLQMISMAEVSGYSEPTLEENKGFRYVSNFFTMNPLQWNAACTAFLNLRQATAPALWGPKGVKPYFGFQVEEFQVNGYPVFRDQLHQRNSVYFLDSKGLLIFHNGPVEGWYYTPPEGPRYTPVPCTTKVETKYGGYLNTAVRMRSRMVRLDNISSPDYM